MGPSVATLPHLPSTWARSVPKLQSNFELRIYTRLMRSPCLSTRTQIWGSGSQKVTSEGFSLWESVVCCPLSSAPPRSRNFIPRVRTETAETAGTCHKFPRRAFSPRRGQCPAPGDPRTCRLRRPRAPPVSCGVLGPGEPQLGFRRSACVPRGSAGTWLLVGLVLLFILV